MKHKITLVPGDGIGPDVTTATTTEFTEAVARHLVN